MDDADNEIAGYALVTGVLAAVGVGLQVLRHPVLGGASLVASFVGLYLTRRAAHRLNAEPEAEPSGGSLNGRLDIRRGTGL